MGSKPINVFGALTVIVATFGALAGALFSDFIILRDHATPLRWELNIIADLMSGYLSLRAYSWLLRRRNPR